MNNKLITIAEREINKAYRLLEDTKEKWNESLDLKLHYAAYESIDFEAYGGAVVTFNDEARASWFTDFCEVSYENFIEYLNELNIDFEESIDRIGRTSSFYISKLHNYNDALDALISSDVAGLEDWCSTIDFDLVDDRVKIIIDNEMCEKEIEDELLTLIDEVVVSTEEAIAPIEIIHECIKDSKEHQVEDFREYVEETWKANV